MPILLCRRPCCFGVGVRPLLLAAKRTAASLVPALARPSQPPTPTCPPRFFVNCLAEEPQTVAEYLVPRIREVPEKSRALLGEGVGSSQVTPGSRRPAASRHRPASQPTDALGYRPGSPSLLLASCLLFQTWRRRALPASLAAQHSSVPRRPPLPLQYIRYLTQTKAYSQIFARLFTGQRKNRFVTEE